MKNLLSTSHGRPSTRRWGQLNTMSDRDMDALIGLPREEALAAVMPAPSRQPMDPVITCKSVTINGLGTAVYGKDGHMEVFYCPEDTDFRSAGGVSHTEACHYTTEPLAAYTHPAAPGALILVRSTRPLDRAAERCVRMAWETMNAAPDAHRDLRPVNLTDDVRDGSWSATVSCMCGDYVGCTEAVSEVSLSHLSGDRMRLPASAVASFYAASANRRRFNHCRPYGAAAST